MNTVIKAGFAAILLLAISCKKENNSIPSSGITDKSSTSEIMNGVAGKYPSVLIGTQKWMTKNLDVTRYRNGDRIPQVTDPTKWNKLTKGAWCWYNNDSATRAVYGKLYNWYAVNDPRGLAPMGWHVSSDAEWDTLTTYLGKNASGKLKDTGTIEAGTGLWYAPNLAATNKSGFTGLPGGVRDFYGGFANMGYDGFWWSSTELDTDIAWGRCLGHNGSIIGTIETAKGVGFSVRCVKD